MMLSPNVTIKGWTSTEWNKYGDFNGSERKYGFWDGILSVIKFNGH